MDAMHGTERARRDFSVWLAARLGERTQGQLAEYVGVSSSTVSRWMNAKALPERHNIRKLAAYLKVEPAEIEALLPTETERFEPDSGALSPGTIDTLAEQVAERTAGAVIKSLSPLLHRLYPDHYTEDEWLRLTRLVHVERVEGRVAADEQGGTGPTGRGDRYALWEVHVRGDCMSPTVPDGSTVLIDRRPADPGQMIAVSVGDDVMVKRLAVHKGERVLVTENGKIVRPGESRVMGVVCYIPAPRGPAEVR
jgi:transcriptional regulator with XRE-family HTH domain